jgi:hypothetical protein
MVGVLLFGPLLGVALLAGAAGASDPPSNQDVGGLDVNGYCVSQGYSGDSLAKGGPSGPNFAYDNWSCTGGSVLNMTTLCQVAYGVQYPNTPIVAWPSDPTNAESWNCYLLNSNVLPIASALATPGEVFHSVPHDLLNAAITIGLLLFITFPASIFNNTFSSHYEEIIAPLRRWRRRLHDLLGLKDEGPIPAPAGSAAATTPGRAPRPIFFLVLVLGAILGGLLNPAFGINGKSLEGFVATLCAFAFGTVVSWWVARRFRRWHHYEVETYLKALPAGLAIGALCVLISRISNFQPGYLYGIVVSLAFVSTLQDRHNAHLVAISTLSTLAVALSAWVLWIPVNHAALEPGSIFLVVIIDDVLASIFVGGLIGSVISLLPIVGMPGRQLASWRRDAWFGVYALAVFLLLQVELNPDSGPTHRGGAPWVTAVSLFLLFGGGTLAMRWYFARKGLTTATASPVVPAPGSAATTHAPPDDGAEPAT